MQGSPSCDLIQTASTNCPGRLFVRWRYLYDEDDLDFQRKKAMVSLIRYWWRTFEEQADTILGDLFRSSDPSTDEIVEWVREHLLVINPEIKWECSRLPGDKFLFVITPEDNLALRPLVNAIVDSAPNMENWCFSSYRPPEETSLIYAAYEGRTEGGYLQDVSVVLQRTEWNQINLQFESELFPMEDEVEEVGHCLTLTSVALGEELFEKWVGFVTRNEDEESEPSALLGLPRRTSIEEMHSEFESMRKEIIAALPDTPLSELVNAESPWTAIGIEPLEEMDDVSPTERISIITMVPSVVLSMLNNLWFFSECHSKCGEVFCYIKSERDPQEDCSELREQLEMELDTMLRKEGVGCVIGSGLGFNHLFVDLALTDVDRSVNALRSVVKNFDLSHSTWLLFFDSQWKNEWVGLFPDAPAPFEILIEPQEAL